MDDYIYPKNVSEKFLKENLFLRDVKLEKYYTRNLTRDLGKFRARVKDAHSNKSFEKFMYVFITDSIRDIILDTIGELTDYMKSMGDVIISGGEIFNLYADFKDRIVTSDIDAKFVPRMNINPKFFGKLQATKLLLWDKLGETAKRLNMRIKTRILSMRKKHPKVFKYLGVSFNSSGPYVTRRYTLIKKKKSKLTGNVPSKGDIFIDVELFALDLNIRYFQPKTGKIENSTLGGILDIPFMRPNEFGYDVVLSRSKGLTYRNLNTEKLKTNNKVYVASKEFLIHDIFLMHKLNLRPDKREKDRQRLLILSKSLKPGIKSNDSVNQIFTRVKSKLIRKRPVVKKNAIVPMNKAKLVNPYKYENYTTKPQNDRLSKQIVNGLNPILKDTKIQGYENSSGNKRFNLKNMKWKNVTNPSYVKNEMKLRPILGKSLPKNFNKSKTLYGYKPNRNHNVPIQILNKSANIPYVGLKK